MAVMECFKDCCKMFLDKEQEAEPNIITIPTLFPATEDKVLKSSVGVSEDYLLSKLPPDGREVPFVLPFFRPSYVQPQGLRYPTYHGGLHADSSPSASARVTFEERKAELAAAGDMVYDPTMPFHHSHLISYKSPRSIKRPFLRGGQTSAVLDQSGKQRLCASVMDLSSLHNPIQRHDSLTSVPSSSSSIQDSFGSNRSIDSSIVSSEDREQDLGKVCVILRYQEDVEQVWITVVECKDLCLSSESAKPQRVGFKGVITMAKPVQFKTSVKEATPNLLFMETFVFTLNSEELRSSALVLRLQTHTPRKHTQGECVISLRTLAPQETQHWLDLNPPCKTHVSHAELQLSTCFQPVSGRIQLQIFTAQNLPASSSLRTQRFFVKVEMFREGCFIMKKKTKILKSAGNQVQWNESMFLPVGVQDHEIQLLVKLYSCGSIRRKYLLGQVMLGFNSPSADAVEQWSDSIRHPEKVVTAWHRLSHS